MKCFPKPKGLSQEFAVRTFAGTFQITKGKVSSFEDLSGDYMKRNNQMSRLRCRWLIACEH
jgi:hypothetical protein